MTPLNHLQFGWLIANLKNYDRGERRLIMLASLLPDLDGLPMALAPILNLLGLSALDLDRMQAIHHTFGHNIFFAAIASAALAAFSPKRRLEIFLVCAATVLLQIVIDNVTSDTWPIMYFWPLSKFDFSPGNFSSWSYLHLLTVWIIQGVLSVFIWTSTVIIYLRTKRTFLELASSNLDRLLTDFIILPFSAACAKCAGRAHYRCEICGRPFCSRHSRLRRNLVVTCQDCSKVKGVGYENPGP